MPLWWASGLLLFAWPLLAILMALYLLRARRVVAPRAFGVWLFFLLWMLGSAVAIDGSDVPAFTYFAATYASATVVFLLVYNAAVDPAARRSLVTAVAAFWAIVVLGGWLGVVLPGMSFKTPLGSILPESAQSSQLVTEGFIAETTDTDPVISEDLGKETPRPKVPFQWSNEWGANLALATPLALAAMPLVRRRRAATMLRVLLVLSLVPIVVSLNRGLWLVLLFALMYGMVARLGRASHRGAGLPIASVVALAALVLALTPLGGLVAERLQTQSNTGWRADLYRQSAQLVTESPVLGHGVTQPSAGDSPRVGTHGQSWRVLVSHGVPAFGLFAGWFGLMAWRTRRGPPLAWWSHLVLVMGLLEMWFYDLVPTQICVLMIAAAVGLREVQNPLPDPEPAREAGTEPIARSSGTRVADRRRR